jgi:hypothetical protein
MAPITYTVCLTDLQANVPDLKINKGRCIILKEYRRSYESSRIFPMPVGRGFAQSYNDLRNRWGLLRTIWQIVVLSQASILCQFIGDSQPKIRDDSCFIRIANPSEDSELVLERSEGAGIRKRWVE